MLHFSGGAKYPGDMRNIRVFLHRFPAQDACFSQKFRCDHYQGADLLFLGQGCGCCIDGLLQTVTTGQVEMAVPV